jgi:hypothetical protein
MMEGMIAHGNRGLFTLKISKKKLVRKADCDLPRGESGFQQCSHPGVKGLFSPMAW